MDSVVDDRVPVKYIVKSLKVMLYEMRIIGTKLIAILIFHLPIRDKLTSQNSPVVQLEIGFMIMKFILISKCLNKSNDEYNNLLCPKFSTCILLAVKIFVYLFLEFSLEGDVANSVRDQLFTGDTTCN